MIAPENSATLPGMTVVCGDSHTATHGAFAALAHGIGTSEVEHVLATQTLIQKKSKTMLITVDGQLAPCVSAKDVALAIIGKIGTAGGTGYCIEFAGSAIRDLSMEGRMTVLQPHHRGRRARRDHRRRRHHRRLSQRAAACAQGRRLGTCGGALADAAFGR